MGTGPVRLPAVAGRFYPGTADGLEREVRGYLAARRAPEKALGVIIPHAGYMYSGSVAGETLASVRVPRSVVILGPNHTGLGPAISVFNRGSWDLPFGEVPVNRETAARILERCELATSDELAHLREHSIEVQLPFLHYASGGDLEFVPITVAQISRDECRLLGQALADVVREGEETLLVASTDMTHYETHQSAKAKDSEAISRILDLDPDGLLEVVRSRKITMCGIFPTAVMLYATLALGASQARLVRYMTSGEVSGDYEQVVGYAGIIVN